MRFDELNPAQHDAVMTTEGPLLVLAGAGSGKTRVITARIAHLLELGIVPERILAVSFTNKAAAEMRERLERMAGSAGTAVHSSTFHSLGVRLLREDPKGFGVPARFSILDQGDVYGLIRSLLREYGIHGAAGERRFDLGAIVQRISLWKNDFLGPTDVARAAAKGDEYDEVAATIYAAYAERLQSLGAVDFDDLVCRIARKLQLDEELRDRWSERFEYLLVDEYQDTNTAQFEMLRGLLSERNNICVVGDDDQAIYGWRGAKVENILQFEDHFPGAKVIRLEANYRSRPPIIHASNALIAHNETRHDKQLVPTRRPGEPVQVVVCPDGEGETRFVCDKIRKLVVDEAVPGDAIAVLYRSARQARPIEARLQEHGVPYRVLGGQAFYDKKEVKDVLAYLKCMVAPYDELAVRRALDVPSRGIGAKTVERLSAFAEQKGIRLIDAVHRSAEISAIGGRPATALGNFSRMLRAAQGRARAEKSVAGPLRSMLDAVKLRESVLAEIGSAEATKLRWQGVEWLLENVERFETRSHGQGRGSWAEYLGQLSLDKGDEKQASPLTQVTLATMHSAKGLEWPFVFVIGCEEGTMPHRRVVESKASDAIAGDIEEERRLFYVALTRARDRLWVSRAANRVDRGREVPIKPSRFLDELPQEWIALHEEAAAKMSNEEMDAMTQAFLDKLTPPNEGECA